MGISTGTSIGLKIGAFSGIAIGVSIGVMMGISTGTSIGSLVINIGHSSVPPIHVQSCRTIDKKLLPTHKQSPLQLSSITDASEHAMHVSDPGYENSPDPQAEQLPEPAKEYVPAGQILPLKDPRKE